MMDKPEFGAIGSRHEELIFEFMRRQAGWFLEKPDFKAAQCSDALHSELAPNKEEPSTFTWAVDNFVEKCPPKGKTGNVPPGAEAPHNPRLCLSTAPWTDLTPTPPPGFLHPAEAAGRAARGPPPTARLQPLRTPAAAVRTAAAAAAAGASGLAPPKSGQRYRGLWAPPPLRPWLRVPLGSAPLGSGTCAPGAAALLLLGVAGRAAPPRGETRVRASFPGLRIPEAGEFCLGPYEHLSASSPPPRGRARARAHSHTHSHSPARVRTAARPEPRNLRRRYSHGLPAATGRPLSAAAAAEAAAGKAAAARPGLRARRPGQSPGEKRRRRARRRGGAAPRPPLVPRPQVIRSQYDAVFIIPGGERAHHVQKHLACRSSTVFHETAFVNSFHLKEFCE
ncbi:PREDICTED: atherin-like [Capra hircus]|uniref:atherin-like n=1 Tax=Capra hircus TaxID=9925 RepID=UPI000846C819|nr:PREDICTED: atherin-like [Capra hircus]